jgi:hypothetical protein
VSLSDSLSAALDLGQDAAVYLSLAPTDAKPGPRSPARDTTKRADSSAKGAKAKPTPRKPQPKADKDTTPVDLTVELVDAAGHTARLPLSHFGVPRRPLEIHILRRRDEERQRFPTQYEMVLQTYVMPIADFAKAAPSLDARHLRSIRLVFDRLVAGTIVVDDIGVSSRAAPFVALGEP